MAGITLESRSDVAETLFIPLYVRAMEAQRSDALVKDAKSVELVNQMDYDFSQIKLRAHDQVGIILRLLEFDRHVREYMVRHPDAVVVHIGCGLDTRFERVDNRRVDWYDLDLPEVIALRQKLIAKTPRCHLVGCSVFDSSWMDTVSVHKQRSFLFLAEGVFPYFEEIQVKSLVLTLLERFPGSELVCDAMTPFGVWVHNLELTFSKIKARLHWGLKHAKDLEKWVNGISLLDAWFYFDRPERRLGTAQWMRHIPPLAKATGIFHYKLGTSGLEKAAEVAERI